MKGVDCASTLFSLLRIGEEVDDEGKHKAFDKWSVAKCQIKCVNNPACKGFNYNNDLGECRYKKSLSHAKTIQRPTHDCWIYESDGSNITIAKGTTATRPPTTPAATTTFEFGWSINKQKDCSSAQSRDLHIGDVFVRNVRQNYDLATIDECQRKCAKYLYCDGFNYDGGMCYYKADISYSGFSSSSTFDCYVYLRPTTTTTTTPLTRPVRPTGTTTQQAVALGWKLMTKVDCVSGMMSLLRIGEEVDDEGKHKAFDTWSVAKCQAKCASNSDCKGFNYDNDLGVCRYKKSLSHARTIQRPTHDCWVYDPAGVSITIGKGTTATRPTTTPSTTTSFEYGWLIKLEKDCSSVQSRDLHIGDKFVLDSKQSFDVATIDQCQRKCAQYLYCDGFNYDGVNGICHYQADISYSTWRSSSTFDCYVYLRPTTTTSTTPLTRPVRPTGTTQQSVAPGWKLMKDVDCVSTLFSLLRIGEEVDDEGKHKAFDTWSVAKCQTKCASNPACKGFNYNNDMGVCRYKKSLSHAKTIQRSTHDCWVYDPAGIPITIGKGTTAARATTTPSTTTTYAWLIKLEYECSSAQSRGLHIGDKFIQGDFRQDFDVASLDKCKSKCAQYVNCDGFNYDDGKGICRYKQGITSSSGSSSSTFDCFVYLKPTTTTTPTPQATQTPSTKASIVTAASNPPPNGPTLNGATPKSIDQRPPPTTSTLRQSNPAQANSNPPKSGTIAGAVVGTILGVAALAGAIVAVMLFLKGRKHADVDNVMTHNTGNLAVGITDAQL